MPVRPLPVLFPVRQGAAAEGLTADRIGAGEAGTGAKVQSTAADRARRRRDSQRGEGRRAAARRRRRPTAGCQILCSALPPALLSSPPAAEGAASSDGCNRLQGGALVVGGGREGVRRLADVEVVGEQGKRAAAWRLCLEAGTPHASGLGLVVRRRNRK